jgi:hypothetical protein
MNLINLKLSFPMIEKRISEAILGYCKKHGIERFASQITKLTTVSTFHNNAAKVYSALNYDFKSTGEIARKIGFKSNEVSTILHRLSKKTTFIKMKRDGKLKFWCKTF